MRAALQPPVLTYRSQYDVVATNQTSYTEHVTVLLNEAYVYQPGTWHVQQGTQLLSPFHFKRLSLIANGKPG
jgi:hypothetical protein